MAAAQLCIDTDILIDYLRGHSDVLEQVVARLDCALTAVTVFELEIGLARSPRQAALFNSLMDLLMVLPLDREAAHAAAQIYEQLGVQGLPIGIQDTLTAGICIARQVPLLTRNVAHYERIADLDLIGIDQMS